MNKDAGKNRNISSVVSAGSSHTKNVLIFPPESSDIKPIPKDKILLYVSFAWYKALFRSVVSLQVLLPLEMVEARFRFRFNQSLFAEVIPQ